MAQKKRISDDAFPWVKNTSNGVKPEAKSGSTKKGAPASKMEVKATRNSVSAVPAAKRATSSPAVKIASEAETIFEPSAKTPRDLAINKGTVFVLFDKKGAILSVAQMDRKYLPESGMPFVTNKDTLAAEFAVPADFAEKGIAEIHGQCVVRGSDSKRYLDKK